ncbi:MAG: hypothetical protein N4A49_00905 [Marinifilaceae bacterium]|jgi:hypothetical protein|nr:hypothetical protein [Marinifilaceae bacterium]
MEDKKEQEQNDGQNLNNGQNNENFVGINEGIGKDEINNNINNKNENFRIIDINEKNHLDKNQINTSGIITTGSVARKKIEPIKILSTIYSNTLYSDSFKDIGDSVIFNGTIRNLFEELFTFYEKGKRYDSWYGTHLKSSDHYYMQIIIAYYILVNSDQAYQANKGEADKLKKALQVLKKYYNFWIPLNLFHKNDTYSKKTMFCFDEINLKSANKIIAENYREMYESKSSAKGVRDFLKEHNLYPEMLDLCQERKNLIKQKSEVNKMKQESEENEANDLNFKLEILFARLQQFKDHGLNTCFIMLNPYFYERESSQYFVISEIDELSFFGYPKDYLFKMLVIFGLKIANIEAVFESEDKEHRLKLIFQTVNKKYDKDAGYNQSPELIFRELYELDEHSYEKLKIDYGQLPSIIVNCFLEKSPSGVKEKLGDLAIMKKFDLFKKLYDIVKKNNIISKTFYKYICSNYLFIESESGKKFEEVQLQNKKGNITNLGKLIKDYDLLQISERIQRNDIAFDLHEGHPLYIDRTKVVLEDLYFLRWLDYERIRILREHHNQYYMSELWRLGKYVNP